MAGIRRRAIVREHPAILRRRFRAATLALIHDPAQRERFLRDHPESDLPALPKKRASAKRSASAVPLERQVLKSIVAALRLDPRVARVQRNTSGVFVEGNRVIRVGEKGLLDLTVYLRSGRFIELECKRPGGKPEPHQQARIDQIRRDGGLAGWCWSIESALAVLPA